MPLDDDFPASRDFEREALRRAREFADTVQGRDAAEADLLARDALAAYRELALSLDEAYYSRRYDVVLGDVPLPGWGPGDPDRVDEEWGMIREAPVEAGADQPSGGAPEADPIGEPAGLEASLPLPESAGPETPPFRLERRRYASRSVGRRRKLVLFVVALAVVGGGIAAGLLLTGGSNSTGSSPPASTPSVVGRMVVRARREWHSRVISLSRQASSQTGQLVVIRLPRSARVLEVAVKTPKDGLPPLLTVGAGSKKPATRVLAPRPTRVSLPGKAARRHVTLLLRATPGSGTARFRLRYRAEA